MKWIFWRGPSRPRRMPESDSSQKTPVSVLLVGIGGMGRCYFDALVECVAENKVKIAAVVEPFPQGSERLFVLHESGIPLFPSLEAAFQSGISSDLTVIASPLHFHVSQSCEALKHGNHVLCEKPVAATIQDADRLIRLKNDSGLWVRIGYQWSYSPAVLNLKRDMIKGLFGRPLRSKSFHLWARDEAYYARNEWAGRIKDSEGRWVLDSPAASAMAHDLHNLLYLIGDRPDRSAHPFEVRAEACRAYDIENFDTVSCRIITSQGVELMFFASHAAEKDNGPRFSLEFEEAVISYDPDLDNIVAHDRKGVRKRYGSPLAAPAFSKLEEAVKAVNEDVPVLCGPEAARAQTLCVNGIQESLVEIVIFPKEKIEVPKKGVRQVAGLGQALFLCYEKNLLPSETGIPWAVPGRMIDLGPYSYFPGGISPGQGGNS